MKIWPSAKISIPVIFAAVLVAGAGCTISFGTPRPVDGGVHRSDDHGRTWRQRSFVRQDKKQTVTIADTTGRTIAFRPGQPGTMLFGTALDGIWLTASAGDRWLPTSLRAGNFPCIVFDPFDADVVYTASGLNVFKSTDGGQRWSAVYTESQPKNSVTCVAADPVRPQRLWALTSGGKLLLSEDAGQRWTLKLTIPRLTPRAMYIDPENPSTLYIFSTNRGIYQVVDGSTWENISGSLADFRGAADIRTVDILENPARWYLGTLYGLLVSADKGRTWSAVPTLVTPRSVPIENVAVDPSDRDDIFVTAGQRLYHTLDAGSTWSVATLPTSRAVVTLVFAPGQSDRLYFSTVKPVKKK